MKINLPLAWMKANREIFNAQLAFRYYLKRNPLRRPVFLLCGLRTGSTLFTSYLHSPPDIWFTGEALNARPRDGLRRAFLSKKGMLNHVRHFLNLSDIAVRGTKILFPHLKIRGLTPQDLHQSFPQAKWIILYRKNILNQYISLQLASKTRLWLRRGKDIPSATTNVKIQVTVQGALEFRDQVCRDYQSVLNFPEIIRCSIWISYEELAENPQELFDKAIFPFLEINQREVHTDLQKQNPWHLSETVSNYDEIKELLQEADFSHSYPRHPMAAPKDSVRIQQKPERNVL